ncbi:histidine kinase dimerization/phosphoacceptor domain -containing protein [uncultured Roseobacter sp.]|uniref:sensor histidine kinase n=1 Tax=uncultured Roseobacter sp. TaxID=114847 RepID=UPI00263466C2|nr:histidine kinase dimerization/phosphoacceptor domain -containing protein [uncultured Roseobacter sp.]
MTGGFLDGDVFRGLAFRILIFLSLALLPFGLIAVVQTREIARQAEISTELSLIGLTEQASGAERTIIQEGFGAAEALSSIIRLFGDDTEACVSFLRNYKNASDRYSLVGYLPADGMMTCSSDGGIYDFSAYPDFDKAIDAPERAVTLSTTGPVSQQPVLVMTHPFFEGDIFAGFMALSVPLSALRDLPEQPIELRPADLVIFGAGGEVVASERPRLVTEADLPLNRSLKTLIGNKAVVFEDVNTEGEERVYAVVSIVPGVTYAMSIWQREEIIASVHQSGTLSIFLPILMWLASLVVAFWAINRLAIRYIRKLGRQMRIFAFNRSLPRSTMGQGVPREFVEIQRAFIGMADSIIRDEASLEDSLREKNILLKEVHHRVKNNLQLISSIMNMQIRRAKSEDARFVLKRLQERILSLATVHKNLYQSDGLERVDAGALVEEIVGQLLVVGLPAGSSVEIEQSYEAVKLDTDDAAPLTLLVSETVTNAMKYIGVPDAKNPAFLKISLAQTDPETADFTIINSVGNASSAAEGTGLGSQLINAFARQLNAQVDVTAKDNVHALTVTFPVPHRIKPIQDY